MEFTVKTSKREEIIDITEKIRELVESKKGKVVLVYVPHTSLYFKVISKPSCLLALA